MSEDIETLSEGKSIMSTANDGRYRLSIYDKPSNSFPRSDKEYSYEEYCGILKGLWQDYIEKGEAPKLLDLPLTDDGLIIETLHCLAPSTWSFPKATPLLEYRESFAYWLKTKMPEIKTKVGGKQFNYLNKSLEDILRIHLSAKKEK